MGSSRMRIVVTREVLRLQAERTVVQIDDTAYDRSGWADRPCSAPDVGGLSRSQQIRSDRACSKRSLGLNK